MSEETLKPCPFCGGRGFPDRVLRDGYIHIDEDAYAHYIRCMGCAAHGPWWKSATGAVTVWNRRKNDDTNLNA